jgi:hypothetical protein
MKNSIFLYNKNNVFFDTTKLLDISNKSCLPNYRKVVLTDKNELLVWQGLSKPYFIKKVDLLNLSQSELRKSILQLRFSILVTSLKSSFQPEISIFLKKILQEGFGVLIVSDPTNCILTSSITIKNTQIFEFDLEIDPVYFR